MDKTITMRAAIRTYQDDDMHGRLQNYCRKMNISMRTAEINGAVIISFTGKEQQLTELEDHLKGVDI